MDYNKAALELHSKFPGKIAVQSLCECKDRDALSTAYTPGVAEPCRKIKANPDDVYTYTMKGRTVAVVTNGTAVLGLGNIGPEAGLPVMEGKCVLFKEFGGVDAFPICLNAKTKEEAIVFAMANPTPEIMPDLAKQAGVRVIGTGRSDFPNQVNNVLAFPGIFKGALSVRARDINPAMKMAAAKAIADLIPDDELNEENILPKAFDPRVADAVAAAVAQAARESGVARV